MLTKIEMVLTQLSEECAEVQKIVSKIHRFGLTDLNPTEHKSNVDALYDELADLAGVVVKLQLLKVLKNDPLQDATAITAKIDKIDRYLLVSADLGRLDVFND